MGGMGGMGGAGGGMPCVMPTDCPDPKNECVTRTCDNMVCGLSNVAAATPTTTQKTGDCKQTQCDGNGKAADVDDNTDVPNDNDDCTDDACKAGLPLFTPKAGGTPCGANNALVCDGAGACIGCIQPSDCAGMDTECATRTCSAGACGVAFDMKGKPVSMQTAGDCQSQQCDGNGGLMMVADNADVLNDKETCTKDLCTNGVPSNPPEVAGTMCSEGTGTLCDGAGKCVACNVASDCPGVDDECQTRTCNAGACGFNFTALGTKIAAQTVGDCKKTVCDGAGGIQQQNDDLDLPNDNNACTNEVCTNGVPSHPVLMDGTSCGGALVCAAGVCTGCAQPSDCPGTDDECKSRTCVAGSCGQAFTAANTPVAAQVAGDCKKQVCDGSGNFVSIIDNADLPATDNIDCTAETCSNGTPAHPAQPLNTACNQMGGTVCDGAGKCVGCNAAAQCPGMDTDCTSRTCISNACGFAFQPAGTVTSSQVAGDCQVNQCDGAGNSMSVASNGDVPADDGIQCTAEVCNAGLPAHPAKPVNTACNQNGGAFCSAAGACVECNAANQCAGTDTDCQTRTCNANACGLAFAPVGTPTSVQAPGDCQENQCNGAGASVSVAKNSDLPADDGNQCTGESCVNGVPAHPNLVQGTVCNQGGGVLCNGSGSCVLAACNDTIKNGSETDIDCGGVCPGCALGKACMGNSDCASGACAGGVCVECNTASQCPGSDTDCHVRTCNANACGVNNIAMGTATSSQTAGDCQLSVCDGSGGAVSVADNTDVPADDGLQCTSEACVAGAPAHPPVAVDTVCNQAGGSFCDGSGACVACNNASECAGSDTECHVRTCSANACGVNNTAAGFVTSAQTSGDCQKNQCDGAGNITSVADLSDVPADDGNQCTMESCTPSPVHTPSPYGAPCSQSGGLFCDGNGLCVGPPTVSSTTPADGGSGIASTTVAVTFSQAMNSATLTAQTSAGACTGSVQVSFDGFANCVAMSSAAAVMSNGNATATFTPKPGLLVNRQYKVRVTTMASSASAVALASQYTSANGFATTSPDLCAGSVVMSQVYGGGGSAAATYKFDFVELHNRGTTAVSLAGTSLQYASAAGTSWAVATLSGSIPAGGYFLVQLGGGTGVNNLPTPDLIAANAINMSGTAGKVAFMSTQVANGATACPAAANTIDFVGYGATATCSEGGTTAATTAPAPSTTTADFRNNTGCGDVNLNNSDFTTSLPVPRNSATAAAQCGCIVQNESNTAAEADFVDTQSPLSITVNAGASSGTIFGQIYEAGVTDPAGAAATVRAQLGYGPATANPEYESGWTWINATYNVQVGNNDEYQASFTAPAAGSYRYVYRFSLDNGVTWTYGDQNANDGGAGSNANLLFAFADECVMTVN
jgi:hypothetical protein